MASNENKFDVWLTRELLKNKLRDRYWSDSEFRNAKNEENNNNLVRLCAVLALKSVCVMALCFPSTNLQGDSRTNST